MRLSRSRPINEPAAEEEASSSDESVASELEDVGVSSEASEDVEKSPFILDATCNNNTATQPTPRKIQSFK